MDSAKEEVCPRTEEQVNLAAITRLQELSTRLIQAGDLHLLLKEILAASTEITGTDKGNIQFVDPVTNNLRIVIHQGLSQGYVDHFAARGCSGACEEAKLRKSRLILEDLARLSVSEHPDLQIILDEGILAVQCTPLISRDGRLLGMLNNHFSVAHRPNEHELRFLDLLARMAADLIERKQVEEKLRLSYSELEHRVTERTAELDAKNAELQDRADQLARLASEITLAEEQERHRLAQVLHDHLQQILVAAKLELSVLARKIKDDEHHTLIADISGLIEESIRESRSLTVELSPPILHEAGLSAGLQWLARRMQHKYGFDVKLDLSGGDGIERDDISILCFQSVRELLFNCVKHSGVKAAAVSVRRDANKTLELRVSDKGRGFDAQNVWRKAARASGSFGLFSIRERLNLLGGRFEISSRPGAGATFQLTIPHGAIRRMQEEEKPTVRPPSQKSAADGRKIRILLVDDHTVMRRGLASMLRQEEDIEIVGEAENGHDAIEKARQIRPDVILMDFSMPLMNGLDATRLIHAEHPDIRIIGLSMFDEAERAEAMIQAGASAYTAKSEPPEVILAAIRNLKGIRRPADMPNPAASQDPPVRIVSSPHAGTVPVRHKKEKDHLQNVLFDA